MTKYHVRLPAAKLTTPQGMYYLLNSVPVPPDSWQTHTQQRWVGVPYTPVNTVVVDNKQHSLHSYARHIIVSTNLCVIEYLHAQDPLYIMAVDDNDVLDHKGCLMDMPEYVWPEGSITVEEYNERLKEAHENG